MNLRRIVKTGLAIYGGVMLTKKIGERVWEKNKDKFRDILKNKLSSLLNRGIDELFPTKEENVYDFYKSEKTFKDFVLGDIYYTKSSAINGAWDIHHFSGAPDDAYVIATQTIYERSV